MPPDEIVTNVIGEGSPAPAPAAPPAGTPPAATGPSTNSYKDGDWRFALPDDVREDESLKVFNDPGTLAKSYIHAKKMIGGDKIPVPNKHWTDNDYQAFYDKLGRPALDKYEVKIPKEFKFVDESVVKDLKPLAHKLGVLPKQVEGILDWFEKKTATEVDSEQRTMLATTKKELDGLKTEWGQAFPVKAAFANRLIDEMGGKDMAKWFKESGMGNNVGLIKLLAKAGETLYKEDTIGKEGGLGSLLSPSEAQKKYNDIVADRKHPYNMGEHPNHKFAVMEVDQLFKMMHPDPEKV